MPKRDPRSIAPPPALIRSQTFQELRPDGPVDFTLRFRAQLDGSREAQMNERTQQWVVDYVTGRPLPNQLPPPAPTQYGPAARLAPVGEGEERKEVVITSELCAAIAGLMMMEYPEEGEEAYTFEDWAVLSVTAPTVFSQACECALSLAAESRAREKNWPRPDTA